MLLRLPFHLLHSHDHRRPLLPNTIAPKRFNSHIFSHPQSLPRTVPILRASLSPPSSFSEDEPDVELGRLLALLPEEMRRRVSEHPELRLLIEVVMDLGRKPLARFPSGDFVISEYPITVQDIEHATAQVLLEHTRLLLFDAILFFLLMIDFELFWRLEK